MQRLLDAIRKKCLPGMWSQGVKLARDEAVRVDRRDAVEVVLRVRTAEQAVAPTVVLYPGDLEWTCDCAGKADPCAHVAAAIIALTQAAERGQEVAVAASTERHLGYRLARTGPALTVARCLVAPDGDEERLEISLSSSLARGAAGLSVSHEDLALDRILGTRRDGLVPPHRIADVLAALAGLADVRLEGRVVKASAEPLFPIAVVEDAPSAAGGGVILRIERDPRIRELVVPGVVLAEGTLRPLGEPRLTGDSLEKLPVTRRFAPAELGELVTVVLPELEKKLTVTVKTRRLPRSGGPSRPRIHFELTQGPRTLSVLPTLVYGDPPSARVDAGRLVHLGGAVPVRDEANERRLIHRLRDELNLIPGRRVDLEGNDGARFVTRLRGWRSDPGDAAPAIPETPPLVPRLVVDGDDFELRFEPPASTLDGGRDGDEGDGQIAGSPRGASAEAVLRAWRDGLGLVPLDGGGWAPLPVDWLERFGHKVADLVAARSDGGGPLPTVALPALAELCDELGAPRPPSLAKLEPLLAGFESIPVAPLPDDLTATLRPYQKDGVSWLVFLRDAGLGALLADDMGLGKTLQTLSVMKGRSLVVCPRSVVHGWADEIRRFRPGMSVGVYHGTKRKLDPALDVTITTYAVMRIDVEELMAVTWDVVVLDEAQAIKNPDSQVARAAYDLRAEFRVALSGTPVENRLEELWSLLHFTNRGLLGGRSDFRDRYASPIAVGDRDAGERLRRRVKPFLLRRLKKDVAPELPPRTDAVLRIELEDDERALYDAVRAATRKEVVDQLAAGGSVLAALEALLRLRQAACHPGLLPGQHAETSSKVTRLLEALEEAAADGHKALVFSQWTSLLDLIEPHLHAAEIRFTRLDGSTNDRAGVVNAFQSPEGPPVMLASLKAGGTGLNLTAADHVFLLDPWWNPAAEDQAADRAHRIGQDRPVMVYRLVAKDTVEEGILALQERKRALADVALGNADQAAGLTRDDLLALLR